MSFLESEFLNDCKTLVHIKHLAGVISWKPLAVTLFSRKPPPLRCFASKSVRGFTVFFESTVSASFRNTHGTEQITISRQKYQS